VERWQQIEEIFHEALLRKPEDRDAYLREVCHEDAGLLSEVSSLLASHLNGSEDDFRPWAASAAAHLAMERISIEPGKCLGPYRIDSFLAAGGMGEVYRATDTRLNREVAIKISAVPFSEAFEMEAKIIASLNHPNICRLYDVGPNYLVMELVEGATLADLLRQGPVPPAEAIGIARQITEALEAAHEMGRIHCDLKPGNIKITPEGVVKLLDFGLAQPGEESFATGDTSARPPRAILGTPAYMSPEQARGAPIDKRTDIWAFGAVLYEMLTGNVAFERGTAANTLDAVPQAEPKWSALPPATPAQIRKLLSRCLERDRKRRLRDIGEARIAIDTAEEEPAPPPGQLWPWSLAGALAVALIVATLGWWRATRPFPPRPSMRLSVEPGLVNALTGGGLQAVFAVSPDDRRLVFTARGADGVVRLATRPLDQNRSTLLPGTNNAQGPFFSPDSEWIGFFADEKLKKISVRGGAPVILCDAPGPRGASWGDDDNIIAALSLGNNGLSRIPAAGGIPARIREGTTAKRTVQRWPQVLPGSRSALFTAYQFGADSEEANIEVLSFETGERKKLERGYFGRYLPSGHLVFVRQNTLFAAPFDLRHLVLTAAPKPILEDVSGPAYSGARNFDFSQSGTFVYLSGTVGSNYVISLLDSIAAGLQPLHSGAGQYYQPRFSPDGKRLAFTVATGHGMEIWVQDLERGTASRRSLLPGRNWWPLWTPDGTGIVFSSGNGSRQDMYWVRADGSGEAQPLADDKLQGTPRSFSPDGPVLAFDKANETSSGKEIWTAPLEGGSEHPHLGAATRFVDAATPVAAAQFSPDGRWLAYVSAELGTTDVFVRPFPGPGGRWQISTGGGRFPIWSRNGRDLFFLGLDQRIRAVSYKCAGGSFSPGTPRLWSKVQVADLGVNSSYDLAPDGRRFAVILRAEDAGEAKPIPQLTVVVNFFDELRREFQTAAQ
jgi:serine/threonine protein kinase/Tol biopolymer transport system component